MIDLSPYIDNVFQIFQYETHTAIKNPQPKIID